MSSQETKSESGPKLAEALSKAQAIIDEAEKRARDIISGADKTDESTKKRAFQEGLDSGRLEALKLAVRLIEETGSIKRNLSEQAAKLAVSIAGAVVGEHVKVNPDTVIELAMKALRESIVGDSVKLVINPEDKKTIEDAIPNLEKFADDATISIEEDGSMTRGGCIVRTEFGEVDASVEALIEVIAQKLEI